MSGDPELDAIAAVMAALAPLDADAQGRVIKWAAERYGVAVGAAAATPVRNAGGRRTGGKAGGSTRSKSSSQGVPDAADDAVDHVDEAAVVAAVADSTGVSVAKLERLFHIDDGVVKILVNHVALGSSEAEKARTTAQIVTVVRKVGMGEADTPFDVIRQECQRKHCYDLRHFGNKHMPNIAGFAVKGDGRAKRLEARNGGVTAFPALVDKVLGES
jgi:hypothetical protein